MQKQVSPIEEVTKEAVRDEEQALTGVAPIDDAHKRRTWGNKIFDLAVYPTIAFGAVYALSTWAVKEAKFKEGSLTNRLYEGLATKLEKAHLSPKGEGKNLSLVLISFFVGTVLMAPIKWLEDHRSGISKRIDGALDTAPADPGHYAKEPKQSWKSVLGGRLATFATVLGIQRVVGEKKTEELMESASKFTQKQWKKFAPDKASAETLKKVDEWTKANAFEMFYTSLCAALVYVLSRTFARHINKHEEQGASSQAPAAAAPLPAEDTDAGRDSSWKERTGSALKAQPQKSENHIQVVENQRTALNGQPAIG